MQVKAKDISKFFKRVYLGGLIKECIVFGAEESSDIVAIDLTSAIYVHISSPISMVGKENKLGIGDIMLLTKYMDSCGDGMVDVELKDNRLIFKHSGTLKYLLTEPDMIPTTPSDEDEEVTDKERFVEPCSYTCPVTEEFRKEFVSYLGLIKPKSVTFAISKRGQLKVSGGLESEHQFEIVIGKLLDTTNATAKEFNERSIEIFGEHIKAVLDVFDYSEKAPSLMFHPDDARFPLSIIQEDDFWCLMPVGDVTAEEGE